METVIGIFSIIGSLATVIIGIIGLLIWRSKLRHQIRFESSKQLLIKAYYLKEQAKEYRCIMFTSNNPISSYQSNSNKLIKYNNYVQEFKKRNEKINKVIEEVKLYLFEAKILYGVELYENFNHLIRLIINKSFDVEIFLESLNPNIMGKIDDNDPNIKEKMKNIFFLGDEEKDEFFTKFNRYLKSIEDILKADIDDIIKKDKFRLFGNVNWINKIKSDYEKL